jgi:hypothetical protein
MIACSLVEDCDVVRDRLELCSSCEEYRFQLEPVLSAKTVEQTRSGWAAEILSDDPELLIDGPHWLCSWIVRCLESRFTYNMRRHSLSPLCMTAPRMYEFLGQADMYKLVISAPTDSPDERLSAMNCFPQQASSPPRTILSGSPPNALMFLRTHSTAALVSSRPRFCVSPFAAISAECG